jgi:hypothetical protein
LRRRYILLPYYRRIVSGAIAFSAVETNGLGGFNIAASAVPISGMGVSPIPLPAALPLFAGGIGGLGLLGWRRKRKSHARVA